MFCLHAEITLVKVLYRFSFDVFLLLFSLKYFLNGNNMLSRRHTSVAIVQCMSVWCCWCWKIVNETTFILLLHAKIMYIEFVCAISHADFHPLFIACMEKKKEKLKYCSIHTRFAFIIANWQVALSANESFFFFVKRKPLYEKCTSEPKPVAFNLNENSMAMN